MDKYVVEITIKKIYVVEATDKQQAINKVSGNVKPLPDWTKLVSINATKQNEKEICK